MIRHTLALGLAALALAPAPAFAQAKPPQPTKAQLDHAAANLRVFVSALTSDKIPDTVKTALFLCTYSVPFRQISENTDKALASKKANAADPNMVVGAMAAICGFKPPATPAAPPKK